GQGSGLLPRTLLAELFVEVAVDFRLDRPLHHAEHEAERGDHVNDLLANADLALDAGALEGHHVAIPTVLDTEAIGHLLCQPFDGVADFIRAALVAAFDIDTGHGCFPGSSAPILRLPRLLSKPRRAIASACGARRWGGF